MRVLRQSKVKGTSKGLNSERLVWGIVDGLNITGAPGMERFEQTVISLLWFGNMKKLQSAVVMSC